MNTYLNNTAQTKKNQCPVDQRLIFPIQSFVLEEALSRLCWNSKHLRTNNIFLEKHHIQMILTCNNMKLRNATNNMFIYNEKDIFRFKRQHATGVEIATSSIPLYFTVFQTNVTLQCSEQNAFPQNDTLKSRITFASPSFCLYSVLPGMN